MSLSPTTPNFTQGVKAFWDRPEGKTGKAILAIGVIGIIAAVVFFWGLIVPFLVAAAANTLELAGLVALLGIITSPIWSSTIRALATNMFQSGCRFLTGMVIEIDPIGMLRNNVDRLRKELSRFGEAITNLSKSKKTLELDMQQKELSIDQNMAKADAAQKQLDQRKSILARTNNPNEAAEHELAVQALGFQITNYKQTAGMAIQAKEAEERLYNQTVKMYNNLRSINQLCEYKIKFLSDQVDFYTKQRKTMLAGQAALAAGSKIMKGDAAQQAIVDQTIEFLNNEAADTLGALEDFNNWSASYVLDMNINNAAAAEMADKKFNEIKQKMVIQQPSLPAATQQFPSVWNTTQTEDGAYTPVSNDNDYNNMFQK